VNEKSADSLRQIGVIIGDLDGRIRQLYELWGVISRDDESRAAARDSIRLMWTDIHLVRAQITEIERWTLAALSRLDPLPTPLREDEP
jgi:hypothetical protein